jgi:hypothetical protein
MLPTRRTTAAERKVLRWLFGLAGTLTVAYLVFVWWSRVEACSDQCALRGAVAGELHFNGGGRFNVGTRCECVPPSGD